MKTNLLSPRLQLVAQFVRCRRVADVGCDHGKLLEQLFVESKIDYALASDISEPSVKKAVALLSANNRNFDYAVGDGLAGIKPSQNIEQVIISGMGGLEIIKIMDNNPLGLDKFVLCPHNNELALKMWLIKNNFKIIDDLIVKDRHIYYNVLNVEKTAKKVKAKLFDLKFGVQNFNGNADFYKYLMYNYEKYTTLLSQLPRSKEKEIKKELKDIKKAIKIWERVNENNVTISKT